MKRRDFMILLGGAAAWPFMAHAQQSRKRMGFLSAYPEDVGAELVGCFRRGLAELGWIEGQTVTADYRWAAGQPERYATFAAELVALKPDILACNSTPAAQALQRVTSEIPIVFMSVADPGLTNSHRSLIIELTTKLKLPVISETREFAAAGGLMSYGLNFCEHFRRAASYVDKILKGAKPSDLPVELPTKFQLIINAGTARTIGLAVPDTVLSLADEVIE